MGKVTGFLEIDRQVAKYQPASDRIRHFREFTIPMSEPEVQKQAARCMDCGIPYCHGPTGCPVHNQIPDWNDLVYNGNWDEARERHFQLYSLFQMMFLETNPIPVKTSLAMMGKVREEFRLPLCGLSPGHRVELEELLQRYQLL